MIDTRSRWQVLLVLVDKHRQLDVLNSDAVEDYIDRTKAPYKLSFIGANRCPQMGRDLASMWRVELLSRHATGIGDGLCYQGFPRWVWSYRRHPKSPDLEAALRGHAFMQRNR